LTIGQLAAETGVRAGTLRMWESRHGFPQAERLPSGHRRYPQEEVERVLEVILARESGLSLSAAIERVQGTAEVPETSIYAGLRRRRPDLHPYPIPKRLLVAVSHAIEDECEAAAAPAVLVGSFQKEAFYRDAEPRWREFARTAELAVALADFDQPDARPGRPLEVPVARNHPLANEWAIVCDAPGFSACLAGAVRSLKIRGELTMRACAGAANGTRITSMRKSAVLGSSSGCPLEQPASSLGERTPALPET